MSISWQLDDLFYKYTLKYPNNQNNFSIASSNNYLAYCDISGSEEAKAMAAGDLV